MLQLKSPYRDGTTHIVMSPLEFMQRLAALVARPRLHLIRLHGVLAPHAKLRAQIVPSEPLNAHEACDHHAQTPPALATALLSGDALTGAAIMFAFGLGTLPNLMAAGLLLRRFRLLAAAKPVRVASGALVLGFGVYGLANAATLSAHIKAGILCFG